MQGVCARYTAWTGTKRSGGRGRFTYNACKTVREIQYQRYPTLLEKIVACNKSRKFVFVKWKLKGMMELFYMPCTCSILNSTALKVINIYCSYSKTLIGCSHGLFWNLNLLFLDYTFNYRREASDSLVRHVSDILQTSTRQGHLRRE